jgi:hypothetical protein
VWRTALREAENQRVSPSWAQIAAAVIGPTVLLLQSPAAGLATSERGDLAAQHHQLGVEPVQHPQCGHDRLMRSRREPSTGFELVALGAGEYITGHGGHALVEQGGVQTLHPRGVFLAEVFEQFQRGTHLQHLSGRDPRLR